MKVEARRFVVCGTVQGVGYRAHVQTAADRLGLAGWVRNRRDGSVELVARGETASLDILRDVCRKGPPGSRVTAVEESAVEGGDDHAPAGSEKFSVLPTL